MPEDDSVEGAEKAVSFQEAAAILTSMPDDELDVHVTKRLPRESWCSVGRVSSRGSATTGVVTHAAPVQLANWMSDSGAWRAQTTSGYPVRGETDTLGAPSPRMSP